MNTPVPPSPEQFGFVLDEDSEDLTDVEVESARVSTGPDGLAAILAEARCPTCSGTLHPTGFALRRRKPHLYSRVSTVCPNGHREDLVIRTSWVNP